MSSYICNICKSKTSYNERYDVNFCDKCDLYTEKICSDPNCFFCQTRPEKPSMMRKSAISIARDAKFLENSERSKIIQNDDMYKKPENFNISGNHVQESNI